MNLFADFETRIKAILADKVIPEDKRQAADLSRIVVEPPRDASHGDLATNAAMVLSKAMGMNPRALAEEALHRAREESTTAWRTPWPLDAWPDVPTKFVLCKDDHLFPPDFLRRLAAERLGITSKEPKIRFTPRFPKVSCCKVASFSLNFTWMTISL